MSGVTERLAAAPFPAKTELATRFRKSAGDYVASLDVARDGGWCVAGLGDGTLLAFETGDTGDTGSGADRFRVRAHEGTVLGARIAPDGTRVLTCGQDAEAKLWTADGALVRALPGGATTWVEHVAWSPSGDRFATAAGRVVRIWTAQGEPLVESEPLASTVTSVAWRRDGEALAACCYGGVHVLSLRAHEKTRHLALKGSLIAMAWSPDARVVAVATQDGSVYFWRLATGQSSEMSGYPFKPKALAWDRDSGLLATSGDASVTVWEFRGKGPEGSKPMQLQGHRGLCTHLAFSPRKGVLASGSQDTSVLLWEPRRGTRPVRFAFLEDEVTALAWHPEHRFLLGADASGTIACWEAS